MKFPYRIMLLVVCLSLSTFSIAAPVDPVEPDVRCPVCGMKVAKYNNWIAQIQVSGEAAAMFDGVKDMLAYYFNPEKYGGSGDMAGAEIWVKDYYRLHWIDGRNAYYVIGSDVLGPMGDEFVPFQHLDAAENFMKDHQGKSILGFDDITADQVVKMQKKHMMKMKMKKE